MRSATALRAIAIGSAAGLLAACGGGSESTVTSTVTVSASSTSAASSTPTSDGTDQTFIQSITMFSGYWAMQSSDTAKLVTLARTVCNWVAEAKTVTNDGSVIIAGTATKLTQNLGSNPPSFDDAEQFVMSSVNYYCPGSIQ